MFTEKIGSFACLEKNWEHFCQSSRKMSRHGNLIAENTKMAKTCLKGAFIFKSLYPVGGESDGVWNFFGKR